MLKLKANSSTPGLPISPNFANVANVANLRLLISDGANRARLVGRTGRGSEDEQPG